MAYFSRIILKKWYHPRPTALALALTPLSLIYGLVVEIRALLYRYGFLKIEHLPVPVVVVGNITAGGTGKTPFVIELARQLRERGYRPGVISRGYGGRLGEHHSVERVTINSEPTVVGDEAIEIVAHTRVPMVVGRDRIAAGRHLLMHHPETNVIISDDGLQHYRLGRNIEIGMLDATRQLGNGLPLPSGPLRERPSRLANTGAIVLTSTEDQADLPIPVFAACPQVPVFRQVLRPVALRQVSQPEYVRDKSAFIGEANLHAIAGIGHPERFFATLRQLGLNFTPHAFDDHYEFTPEDLDFGNDAWVIMTEKDAVKCRHFADERCWFLNVATTIPEPLLKVIEEKLHESC